MYHSPENLGKNECSKGGKGVFNKTNNDEGGGGKSDDLSESANSMTPKSIIGQRLWP